MKRERARPFGDLILLCVMRLLGGRVDNDPPSLYASGYKVRVCGVAKTVPRNIRPDGVRSVKKTPSGGTMGTRSPNRAPFRDETRFRANSLAIH